MTNPNYGNDVSLLKAQVITANGNGATIVDTIDKSTLRLVATATDVAGTTPSVTITVQTSADKGVTDAWRDVAAFPAITANGSQRKAFTGLDRYSRLKWAVAGTNNPTAKITVDGEAV